MIGNETIVYKCNHNVDMSNALPLGVGRQDARNNMPLSNNVFPSSSAFERHFYQDLADTDEVATNTYTWRGKALFTTTAKYRTLAISHMVITVTIACGFTQLLCPECHTW